MKTDKEILEGNKLIAEFMTGQSKDSKVFFKLNCVDTELKYHPSWDWLMPVIGKISTNCENPEELDNLKYALLCNDINTAYNFVIDYLEQ